MLKIGTCILAALTLTACISERPTSDWACDCERNFSENSSAMAGCKAEKAAKMAKVSVSKVGVTTVTTTPVGPNEPGFEGDDKEKDNSHVN